MSCNAIISLTDVDAQEIDLRTEEVAISVEGLGKCYQIYEKPRDRLLQIFCRGRKNFFREFWALRDVSFKVRKGETVGIIGRNGSGKSTLLQMICGTLNPTLGNVTVHGKVAALLELGAGFNPEFTGRDNVYMAASLYGLSREEVTKRFDLIETFADIGEHIDQPVKNYSSGMYVRLAFAVIAHVDADILVIDEALAVGDAVFTQKCMRFIRKFKEKGTLIFVSHDMNSVLNLCQDAVWLHKGDLVKTGSAKEIAEDYLQYTLQEVYGEDAKLQALAETNSSANQILDEAFEANEPILLDYESKIKITDNLSQANGWKSGSGEITDVKLTTYNNETKTVYQGGESVKLVIKAKVVNHFDRPIIGFIVKDRLGQDLFGENTLPFTSLNLKEIEPGQNIEGEFKFKLPMLPNGQYVVMASLANGDINEHVQHHFLHDALIINVSSSKVRWGLVGINFTKVDLRAIV